jgi:hypothetical protein
MSTGQLAARLGVHKDTVKAWRVSGEGPPFVKFPSGMIRYDTDTVEAWLVERRRKSTSQG